MSTKKDKNAPMTPQDRLKILSNCSNAVEVDPHIPPKRYYRSGIEMVRMANVYYEEGNLENAYVLYMKFMTLFLEKIRKHPDFGQVPGTLKQTNNQKLREIMPKAEKLKQELLQQYSKEYNLYKVLKEKEEGESLRMSMQRSAKNLPKVSDLSDWKNTVAVLPPSIDNIMYPDPNITEAANAVSEVDDKTSKTTFNLPSTFTHPTVDRSSKPSQVTLNSTTSSGLRMVLVPGTLMPKFLMLAKHNTMSNKETCGILAGTLDHNQLIITHLIVPKQKGTSDSCTTMNEEEIFDYQDQHNLITIGWIHTHPTQTAFLSSVDLHTHCPYQLLMPEAIAIVCAPKYNDTGIFVLTPNYGLSFISNCRNTGFHPHPTDPPLFMPASHIKLEANAPLDVLDLRT